MRSFSPGSSRYTCSPLRWWSARSSILDLRLLGLASLDRPVGKLTRDVLPCTWVAFAFAAVTGSLLFSAKAGGYAGNFFFRGKLILLVMAALNMALFHAFT